MRYRVVWFKRDLRVQDHWPLLEAARRGPVLCLYVVEPGLWAQPDAAAQRARLLERGNLELYETIELPLTQVLADMGYREVNLNLGCPSGTVVAKGKGSGFLRNLDELEVFLSDVCERSPLPVSSLRHQTVRQPPPGLQHQSCPYRSI